MLHSLLVLGTSNHRSDQAEPQQSIQGAIAVTTCTQRGLLFQGEQCSQALLWGAGPHLGSKDTVWREMRAHNLQWAPHGPLSSLRRSNCPLRGALMQGSSINLLCSIYWWDYHKCVSYGAKEEKESKCSLRMFYILHACNTHKKKTFLSLWQYVLGFGFC